jgi:hypothetical protein
MVPCAPPKISRKRSLQSIAPLPTQEIQGFPHVMSDLKLKKVSPLRTKEMKGFPPAVSALHLKKVSYVMSALPARLTEKKNLPKVSPQDHLIACLKSQGIEVKVHSYSSVEDLFEAPKKDEIEAYGFEALDAVRTRDIALLESFHAGGRPLKCSNRFGESILHLACRKGFTDVTDFLINKAGVPLWVKDDFGRNPLHDACWTCEPNFELMDLVIAKCPDLLLISDARGHTPLSYVRRGHWNEWIKYIDEKINIMKPKRLCTIT